MMGSSTRNSLWFDRGNKVALRIALRVIPPGCGLPEYISEACGSTLPGNAQACFRCRWITNCRPYSEITPKVCGKRRGGRIESSPVDYPARHESTATEARESKSGPDFAATRSSHTELRGGEAPDRNCARGKDKPRNAEQCDKNVQWILTGKARDFHRTFARSFLR